MKHEKILTDNPIRQIWNRLALLSSLNGAEVFLKRKVTKTGSSLETKLLKEKAQGLAFAIRSAREYFKLPVEGNLTSACLAYYYGTFSLLKALLLANIENEITLKEIEKYTSFGHGLSTLKDDDKEFPVREKIMILNGGFLKEFLKDNKFDISKISVSKRYKSLQEVEGNDQKKIFSIKDLLARIPDLKNIYVDIFQEHPDYISLDYPSNPAVKEYEISFYLSQNSKYLTPEKIREVLGWSTDIKLEHIFKNNDEIFETIDKHKRSIFEYRKLYKSVLSYDCYVNPLFEIEDILLFYFIILYCLSIWVRYRPALWREICEGELDLYMPLFTNFLMAVERIVPNIVIDKLYEKRFLFTRLSYL